MNLIRYRGVIYNIDQVVSIQPSSEPNLVNVRLSNSLVIVDKSEEAGINFLHAICGYGSKIMDADSGFMVHWGEMI